MKLMNIVETKTSGQYKIIVGKTKMITNIERQRITNTILAWHSRRIKSTNGVKEIRQ